MEPEEKKPKSRIFLYNLFLISLIIFILTVVFAVKVFSSNVDKIADFNGASVHKLHDGNTKCYVVTAVNRELDLMAGTYVAISCVRIK